MSTNRLALVVSAATTLFTTAAPAKITKVQINTPPNDYAFGEYEIPGVGKYERIAGTACSSWTWARAKTSLTACVDT